MKTISTLLVACAAALALSCARPSGDTPTSAGATAPLDGAQEAVKATIPFGDAHIYFEYNATADDAGVQVFLDAEDWKSVSISDGRGRDLLDIRTGGGMRELGLTELRFEGAEPEPAETYAAFPAGEYHFSGVTIDRVGLTGSAFLSHDIPAAPSFSPSQGETVDPDHVVVTWNPVAGIDRYQVIVESDANGFSLEVSVSATTQSLQIPPTFLVPGTEYKAEVLAIAPSGNRTITEGTFFTGP